MQAMTKHKIYPFNNGQFIFRYSEDMAQHFQNIVNLIESLPHHQFIDQQCMNQYFNAKLLSKSGILDKYTQLFAAEHESNKSILHFSGNIHDGQWKIDVIRDFIQKHKLDIDIYN
jgi:hypothetical protein